MAEYIDREVALKLFDKVGCYLNPKCLERQKKQIEDLPTADVAEVRHGKWLQTTEPLGYRDVDCVECSVCHDSWVVDEDFDFETCEEYWNYCPNCGAKMDVKGDAE